jgi:hypothetical protein
MDKIRAAKCPARPLNFNAMKLLSYTKECLFPVNEAVKVAGLRTVVNGSEKRPECIQNTMTIENVTLRASTVTTTLDAILKYHPLPVRGARPD